jgi:hypothetical protein
VLLAQVPQWPDITSLLTPTPNLRGAERAGWVQLGEGRRQGTAGPAPIRSGSRSWHLPSPRNDTSVAITGSRSWHLPYSPLNDTSVAITPPLHHLRDDGVHHHRDDGVVAPTPPVATRGPGATCAQPHHGPARPRPVPLPTQPSIPSPPDDMCVPWQVPTYLEIKVNC